jgi:predicted ATPase
MKHIFFLIFLFFQSSCGSALPKVLLPEEIALKHLILEEEKKCLKGGDCSYEDLQFENASLEKSSVDQRILIIDSEREQNFPSLFYQNKNRALALFKVEEEERDLFFEYHPKVKTLKALGDIFSLIKGCEKKGKKIEDLEIDHYKLLQLHHKMEWEGVQLPEAPHGQRVFDILARYNPEAQFVVGSFPEVSNKTFCSIRENEKEIHNFFKKTAEFYLEIIQKYNINYVNISYASTFLSLVSHNKRICNDKLTQEEMSFYLREKTLFLDLLSEGAPSVLFFQALPNTYEKGYLNRLDSRNFAAKKRDNFLRISYWTSFVPQGENISQRVLHYMLPLSQRKIWPVVDFYINSGFDEGEGQKYKEKEKRNILEMPYAGFYLSSDFNMSNSFATPVALSYVNYLRQGKKMFDLTNGKKILDPLLTHELLFYK